ncbi:MAG: substrate-binding domain-containing protein, partial [Pseudomonadota bacterium]
MIRFLLASLVGLTALAPSVDANDKPLIGAAIYGLSHDFMQRWAAAIEQHPAVAAGEVTLTIFDGRYEEAVQADQFRQMIDQGYEAIIFVPLEQGPGADLVAKAHAAGIPVVGSNTRVKSALLTAYIGSDDVD